MPLLRAFACAAALLFRSALAVAGESDPQDFTQIKNGQYLAILSDCGSCHTVPGQRRFAGGRPKLRSVTLSRLISRRTAKPELALGLTTNSMQRSARVFAGTARFFIRQCRTTPTLK
jgi:hypothetical protein